VFHGTTNTLFFVMHSISAPLAKEAMMPMDFRIPHAFLA
jgi:hypothetical protein